MIKNIIFDFDGVLVDSEPISNKALVETLNKIGLKITYKESLDIFWFSMKLT